MKLLYEGSMCSTPFDCRMHVRVAHTGVWFAQSTVISRIQTALVITGDLC